MLKAKRLLLFAAIALYYLLVAGQLDKGDSCSLSSGRGTCRLLDHCASVYKDLISGYPPERICRYVKTVPVICCPNAAKITNEPSVQKSTTTTTMQTITTLNTLKTVTINARPAQRMCAEYAKKVYALVNPPVLVGGEKQLVNISLCAINFGKLIVGGTKAEPKEFPHMAAIGFGRAPNINWKCGGSLISELYVLTAAHCTVSSDWGNAEWVRVGSTNLKHNNDGTKAQNFRIADKIRHPEYKKPIQYNDIGLLKLRTPVTFNAYVRPACLSLSDGLISEKAVATGWGVVDWFDNDGPNDLFKVTLPLVSYETCSKTYIDDKNKLPNGIIDAKQLCAGKEGKDTCQGDSGGPLMIYSQNERCMYDIIGVTSFGKVCGSISPGIYTKVYAYLSWIEKIVWPNLS